MSEHQLPSNEKISSTPRHTQEFDIIQGEKKESEPVKDAFIRCGNVFKSDKNPENSIQNIEKFFDDLKKEHRKDDCYRIIATCSESDLQKLFDTDRFGGFEKMCSPAGIGDILKFAVNTDKQAVQADKQAVQADKEILNPIQQKTLIKLRAKIKNHPHISEKNKQIIRDNNPDSKEFKDAVKNILAELKAQAQKSGDFQEYAKFVTDFHAIGAVSEVEYAVLQREMDTLTEGLKKGNSDDAGKGYKLPEGFHESQSTKGVYTRYAPIGEKFDEVVTIQDGKGSKDIISPRSGYSIHLADAVNPEEYKFIDQEANLRAKLESNTKARENILTKYKEFVEKMQGKGGGETEEEQEKLKEAKIQKEELEMKIEVQKQELEAKLMKLAQEKTEKKPTRRDRESREEQARETIQFVDDMGIYMLGVENVDRFFSIISTGSSNGKIDISNGLDNAEKAKIKQAFIELLGQDIFEPNPLCRLREGKTNEDIKKLLVEKKIYKEGEIPPVKLTDLKMAMTKNNA